MKFLTRTIIVLVAFSLVTGSLLAGESYPESTSVNAVGNETKSGFDPPPGGHFVDGKWVPAGEATSSSGRRRVGRSTGYKPAIGPMGGRKVLVVPSGQVKAKELAAITEDMQVMSHILDQRFKETRRIQGVFIDFGDFFGRDNRATEAIYLQGYGVLFSIEVNFSFSPPPKAQDKQVEQQDEQVDSAWEKARRQVFSPGGSQAVADADSPEQDNSRMVEELKRDLIATLKHAANIRNLQPDEWVILTVIGGQRHFSMGFGTNFPTGVSTSRSRGSRRGAGSSGGMGGFGGGMGGGGMGGGGMGGGGMGGYGGGSSGFVVGGYGGMGGMVGAGMGGMYGGMGSMGGMFSGTTFSSSTVLTIRAKKSDVDDFAKGGLNFEQFQERVQIFMY